MFRLPARYHVLGLVAAVIAPVWLFAAYLLVQYALGERARFESDAKDIAKQVSLVVEGELSRLGTIVTGLAKSSAFERRDLEVLSQEADRLVAGTKQIILLQTESGLRVLNSRVSVGADISKVMPATLKQPSTKAEVQVAVSSSYGSPDGVRISVGVPVLGGGGLIISVLTDHIRSVMVPAVPEGWTVAIGDQENKYVARSTLHDQTSGTPGLPEYVNRVVGESGTFVSPNFQGHTLLAGYYRSPASGWFYAANIPISVAQAPLWRSLWAISAIAALALLVSSVLGYAVAKRFTIAAEGLAARAEALGRGLSVEPLSTPITEFNSIGIAMQDAAHALSQRTREMKAVLETAPAAVWFTYDPQARLVVRNRFAAELMGISTSTESDFGSPSQVIETIATQEGRTVTRENRPLSRAMRGEVTDNQEFTYTLLDGTNRVLLTSARPIKNANDGIIGAVQVSLDISERKRGEEQRKLLVNELNHRVKNSLAVVQSIVAQTLRNTSSVKEAREALVGRLISLGKAHDILTQENWSGADLRELVVSSVSPHAQLDRFAIAGPQVWVEPNLAMSLAMAFHELTTNAIKYGSLSVSGGEVSIAWTVQGEQGGLGDREVLTTLVWREQGGPKVTQTGRKGFGTRMLERVFSAGDGNSLLTSFEPGGVVHRFTLQTCERRHHPTLPQDVLSAG